MADNHTKEVRSYNMSRIQSRNNKIEDMVRKYLFSKGFRYRKNVKTLPGKPDIVMAKYKTVIFINGCFWHMHEGCSNFVLPKSNLSYWLPKLTRNKERDTQNIKILESNGWNVIIIWECELKKDVCEHNLERIYKQITCKSNL